MLIEIQLATFSILKKFPWRLINKIFLSHVFTFAANINNMIIMRCNYGKMYLSR